MTIYESDYLDRKLIIRDHRTTKSISIKVKQNGNISITIPKGYSLKKALKFLDSKSEWLKATVSKINEIEEKNRTIILPDTTIKTKFHTINITAQKTPETYLRIKNNNAEVVLSDKIEDFSAKSVQEFIEKAFIETFRIEAKQYLPQRVEYLALKHNLSYNNISIKAARTRWGSCSSSNNINLSLFLMKLPNRLIDYVILHELTHTIEKNHSSKFWHRLSTFDGEAKQIDKELKKFSTNIKIDNNAI